MLKAFPDQNKTRSVESNTNVLLFARKRNPGLAKPGWAARAWSARHNDSCANPRAPIKVDDIVVRHADAA
jgi:hypothetical protein